jgi:hypothetical protein
MSAALILPRLERGTARSGVEGYSPPAGRFVRGDYPYTSLRLVPLPLRGRI